MQDAYEDFVKQIVTISHSEDYTHVFRMLNLTRIEIAPLKGTKDPLRPDSGMRAK